MEFLLCNPGMLWEIALTVAPGSTAMIVFNILTLFFDEIFKHLNARTSLEVDSGETVCANSPPKSAGEFQ